MNDESEKQAQQILLQYAPFMNRVPQFNSETHFYGQQFEYQDGYDGNDKDNGTLSLWKLYVEGGDDNIEQFNIRTVIVNFGIHSKYRGIIWSQYLQLWDILELNSTQYPLLYFDVIANCAKNVPKNIFDSIMQLDLDMHRVQIPQHQRQDAFQILLAYTNLDPAVGYVQGMTHYLAPLLNIFGHARLNFTAFSIIMKSPKWNVRQYFSGALENVSIACEMHDKLLLKFQPKIYNHLQDIGLNLHFIIPKWILSGFRFVLDDDFLLHYWDIFIMYGELALHATIHALFIVFQDIIFKATHIPIEELMPNTDTCLKFPITRLEFFHHVKEIMRILKAHRITSLNEIINWLKNTK